ncbi:HEPN domain-containing protein [Burkholderia ubonensis]|uniref:HEPN domain-containing protein n=1 Tax=Burkholderia ubonensis TaxID=101571 RepID=UPI000A4F7EB4|nr:HEPN domain-containing protein [Burkholderia ubonensis]
MDLILTEFQRDLATITRQLDLLDEIKKFSAIAELSEKYRVAAATDAANKTSASQEMRAYLRQATSLHGCARTSHAGLPVVSGTMVLYIAGRFEEFTRTSFEDLCQQLAQRASSFKALPKKMQESLITFTAIVMQSPRKYQHGDGAVASFAQNLASNLSAAAKAENINYQCLSITDANMRPDTLSDLYDRIGAKEIWKKIGQQASVQAHFSTQDSSNAESLAKSKLGALMDERNSIAHPSTSIVWPDTDKVRGYIKFLDVLAAALSSLSLVFAATLCRKDDASDATARAAA